MKIIDFSAPLNEDDEQYVNERPWLKRDAELAGHTVRFESEGPFEDEADEASDAEDYSDKKAWTVAKLSDEIDRRNEERDEDDLILPDGTKRDELVEALIRDDEAAAESEDEDDEEATE